MTSSNPSQEDVSLIQLARNSIEVPEIDQALDFLVTLLLSPDAGTFRNRFQWRFRRKFQEITAPVMAKSAEDTMFYRYSRLIALNEVGGDPGRFGADANDFHARFAQRTRNWPHAMLASSTHDTKRAEDARARLLALTGMAEDWHAMLSDRPYLFGEAATLDRNELYLLLQSIIGAWPLELLFGKPSDASFADFRDRIAAFLVKALRETKRKTSWSAPNACYEKTFIEKATQLLDPDSRFVEIFRPFVRRLAIRGVLIRASRELFSSAPCPALETSIRGQNFGIFLWSNPDNRRPVNYKSRIAGIQANAPLSATMRDWQSGHLKQYCIRRLLADRRADPDLYAFGSYQPLIPQDSGTNLHRFSPRSSAVHAVCRSIAQISGKIARGHALPRERDH